jgi:hypothetical protein
VEGNMTEHRYPFAPLKGHAPTHWELCQVLRISKQSANAFTQHGITLEQAERFADRIQIHPYELWPEMADHIVEAMTKVCVADGCNETFEPKTKRRLYCSPRCRDRRAKANWARRRYQTDAEFRERRKAQAAARYLAERDYINAQRRNKRGSAA